MLNYLLKKMQKEVFFNSFKSNFTFNPTNSQEDALANISAFMAFNGNMLYSFWVTQVPAKLN